MRTLPVLVTILILFVAVAMQAVVQSDGKEPYVVIYGMHSCPHCRAMSQRLKEWNVPFVFCDISSNDTCRRLFSELVSYGFPAATPTMFIGDGKHLKAIVIGEFSDENFLYKLLDTPDTDNITIYFSEKVAGYIKIDEKFTKRYYADLVAPLVSRNTPTTSVNTSYTLVFNKTRASLTRIAAALVSLALLDSINPCTLVIYSFLVLNAVSRKRRLEPIVFIIIVFTAYLLMGLGLSYILVIVPAKAVSVLAIIYGFYLVIKAVRGKKECIWCSEKSVVGRLLSKISMELTLFSAILAALFVSFVLLPCTSGPYIVFTKMISGLPLAVRLLLLIGYNTLFVSPMIVAGILVSKINSVAAFVEKHSDIAELALGIALIILGVSM